MTVTPPEPVVLRYEDTWGALLSQRRADHDAGLVPGAARGFAEHLLDPGTMREIGLQVRRGTRSYDAGEAVGGDEPVVEVPADALVSCWGSVGGRTVFVVADDAELGGPARAQGAASKAARIRDHALAQGRPLIQLYETVRLAPGQFLGAEFAQFGWGIDLSYELASTGRIPKLAVARGRLDAQAAYEAATSHYTILVGSASALAIAADPVGDGGTTDAATTMAHGLADAVVGSLDDAAALARRAIGFFPDNCWSSATPAVPGEPTGRCEPGMPAVAVAAAVVDADARLELRSGYAAATPTALARIAGLPTGVVALDGDLSGPACAKATRLVDLCEHFRLPLVVVTAGPLGSAGASAGDLADLATALAAATVPIVAVDVGGSAPTPPLAPLATAAATWSPAGRDSGVAAIGAAGTRRFVADALAQLPVDRPPAWADPRAARGRRSLWSTW